jgi:hypothetical protein
MWLMCFFRNVIDIKFFFGAHQYKMWNGGEGRGVELTSLCLRIHTSEEWPYPQIFAFWGGLNSVLSLLGLLLQLKSDLSADSGHRKWPESDQEVSLTSRSEISWSPRTS